MMSPPPSGIEVIELSKRYGARQVLKRVSFSAPAGSITGLLGPNGSGKSTTMRAMTSLSAPSSGSVLFDGARYDELANPGAIVGTLLDASAHHSGRTAYETVRQAGLMIGSTKQRVHEVVDAMGLATAASRRFGALSLGMRQRVGLAIAFLSTPRYLILDEPMNGLDVESIGWVRNELIRFAHGDGGAVVISSHLLQELQAYVDRVAIISRGELVLEQKMGELKGDAGCEVVVVEADCAALERLLNTHGVESRPLGTPGGYWVKLPSRRLALRLLDARIAPVSLAEGRTHSLEEVYLRMTRGEYELAERR
ncbi:ATP-binding cassette domain-containing protein [Gryllotalpicola reticulitermitis]|uniref:ATP-binding cassette domain-containing protein n=1 Tax=Gryllotalpicola reticulitermitis TaxID=1184153 RepID=A0ABV8Q7H9_9MICO